MDEYGWHFLPEDGCLANGDGREVVVGETLCVEPPLKMCEHGLHWCRRALDALGYAPSFVVEYVRGGGKTLEEGNKCCSTERTCLAMADAREVVQAWVDWCVERAIRYALTGCREPGFVAWAEKWLSGEDRSETAAEGLWAAWSAAEAAETTAEAAAVAAEAARAAALQCPAAAALWSAAGEERSSQNAELERRLRELLKIKEA